MPRHRYFVLDSYRFIAALGIVAYHFEAHFSPFTPGPHDRLLALQTLVDFFFVLSGFVLAHTYGTRIRSLRGYADFLRKRFARVYPLHAATLALCVGLYLVVRFAAVPMRDRSIIDMSALVPNLFLVQAWGFLDHPGLNEPAWSISAEAFVYLLFPLLMILAVRMRPVATIALAMLLAALIDAGRRMADLPPGEVATFDFGMLRAVPMFLAGIAAQAFVESRPTKPLPWIAPHALFAAVLVLMALQAPLAVIDLLYPPLVVLIALAERGGRPTLLAAPGVVRLGEASFAIYMVHTFVQIGCVGFVRRTGWTSLPALWAVASVGTLVIVALGCLSFHFFETPMRAWLSGSPRARRTTTIMPCRDPTAAFPETGVPN